MGLRRTILILLLVTAACRRSDGVTPPDTTVPTSHSTTATAVTTTPDPYAIPTRIDAAYVNRVLVELNKVYGDVVRKIRATGRYERSDLDPLRAIFNDPLLDLQALTFKGVGARDPSKYRQPIGDRLITVEELITVRSDCIFARASFDVSAVAAKPPLVESRYITLRLTQPDANPARVNPTPWSMSGESDARQDQCAA